jgi:hypothetical protein
MISSRENYHNKGILSMNLTPFKIRIQTVISAVLTNIAPHLAKTGNLTEFSTLDISCYLRKYIDGSIIKNDTDTLIENVYLWRRKMKKILFIITLFWLIQPPCAYAGTDAHDNPARKFAYKSLKQALIHSLDVTMTGNTEDAITNPNGLIVLLGHTDTEEARDLLLELVEIHIGEAHGEALTYAILKQGNAMRYALKSVMDKSCECALIKKGSYAKSINRIRCITKKTRNMRIKFYLEMIDKGETTELLF